jgi:hypothetical protein
MNTTEEKTWISARDIVNALAYGVTSADPYYPGYAPPPGFADFLHDAAVHFEARHEPELVAMRVSLDDVKRELQSFIHEHPACREWNAFNAPESGYAFSSRYSPLPKERQFIDLDAIWQNAMWLIHRRDESLR